MYFYVQKCWNLIFYTYFWHSNFHEFCITKYIIHIFLQNCQRGQNFYRIYHNIIFFRLQGKLQLVWNQKVCLSGLRIINVRIELLNILYKLFFLILGCSWIIIACFKGSSTWYFSVPMKFGDIHNLRKKAHSELEQMLHSRTVLSFAWRLYLSSLRHNRPHVRLGIDSSIKAFQNYESAVPKLKSAIS